MKRTFFTLLSLFIFPQLFSQTICQRTVADFGTYPMPGGYEILGSATVIDSSGTLYVTLSSDFFTLDGPDLFLYLSINDEAPTVAGNTNVEVAPLISNSGAQSYVVPGSYSLSNFDYVSIHCKDFNHFWDGGPMGSVSCVTVTGISDPTSEENFRIINNGFSENLLFQVTDKIETSYLLNIYSIDGKLVSSSVEQTNTTITINNLPNGILVATAAYGNKLITRRFVVQ